MKTDPDCIFCKIVKGEISAEKIYETKDFLVFLDIRPLSPGHSLVIPKDHYRWVWDVPNAGEYFETTQKVAKAMQKAFNCEIVTSKIVGEEVHHAHIWLVPDYEIKLDKNDFKGNADKIRMALK